MTKGTITILIITLVVIAGLGFLIHKDNTTPGKLDGFAQCLKEKGAVFYGAFWCPHCQNQKKMFGRSEKFLPYVECSTPNGQGQLSVCTDKGVKSYPTWIFSDGTSLNGEVELSTLAEKTQCVLPEDTK